jgi:hypothetical protein
MKPRNEIVKVGPDRITFVLLDIVIYSTRSAIVNDRRVNHDPDCFLRNSEEFFKMSTGWLHPIVHHLINTGRVETNICPSICNYKEITGVKIPN